MRETLFHWVRGEHPYIDEKYYNEILSSVPPHIAENMEKARKGRKGEFPVFKAGAYGEELLSPIITDPSAISSTSAEAKLCPTLLIPQNYMQAQGLPGRTLRFQIRGRVTTLTTAATLTFRNRIATTDVITGTTLSASGAITMDTTAQTNTMFAVAGEMTARSPGIAGTVFAMGEAKVAAAALTIANQQACFMGSAGSINPAAAGWDMSQPQYFQMTAQWSLATAYSIQAHEYLLESLN